MTSALRKQELAEGKRLTSTQKAETLGQLVADGWLAKMPARPSAFTIGVRKLAVHSCQVAANYVAHESHRRQAYYCRHGR